MTVGMIRRMTEQYDDPVYRHSLREAFVILALWALSFAWVVGYSYVAGYPKPGEQVEIYGGLPTWVLWGVAVPWVVSGMIAIILCLGFIRDDDLGHADDEVPEHETSQENAEVTA